MIIITFFISFLTDPCGINFNKIGCFKENPANPLLNVNIFTDRDPEKPTWSGKYLNFPNWYEYLPGLLCRCAEETQKKGWKIFAIRKWGVFLTFCHRLMSKIDSKESDLPNEATLKFLYIHVQKSILSILGMN